MCVWLWIQIVVLATQDIVGPRYGVPAGWTPTAWDYHPILREENLEGGGLPIGLMDDHLGLHTENDDEYTWQSETESTGKKKHSHHRVIDCSICREVLEIPVIKAGDEATTATSAGVTGAFARRSYMVTPCRHIFHTACLESWMQYRLQCPICREELPPL